MNLFTTECFARISLTAPDGMVHSEAMPLNADDNIVEIFEQARSGPDGSLPSPQDIGPYRWHACMRLRAIENRLKARCGIITAEDLKRIDEIIKRDTPNWAEVWREPVENSTDVVYAFRARADAVTFALGYRMTALEMGGLLHTGVNSMKHHLAMRQLARSTGHEYTPSE
jgi:hypothetical protein